MYINLYLHGMDSFEILVVECPGQYACSIYISGSLCQQGLCHGAGVWYLPYNSISLKPSGKLVPNLGER